MTEGEIPAIDRSEQVLYHGKEPSLRGPHAPVFLAMHGSLRMRMRHGSDRRNFGRNRTNLTWTFDLDQAVSK